MLQSREFFNGSLRPLIFVQNIHFIVKTTQYLCKLFYHVAFYGGWLTWPFANWGFFQAFTRFLGWGPEKRNVLKSIGLFPDRFRAATGGRAGGSWRSACRWRCWSTGQTRILTAALVLTQKFIIQFILEFHQILRIKPFLVSRSVWTGSSRARRFPGWLSWSWRGGPAGLWYLTSD